ncbi:addiction module protein [Sorangium sp. So ce1024]|uniref:addiction module protein n=1 Tax=unclassified Sorangium TaxID=2621164 RepID=UPI003F528C1F
MHGRRDPRPLDRERPRGEDGRRSALLTAAVAAALFKSLDERERTTEEVEAAWVEEIQQRLADVDAHRGLGDHPSSSPSPVAPPSVAPTSDASPSGAPFSAAASPSSSVLCTSGALVTLQTGSRHDRPAERVSIALRPRSWP